jgi:hypothetical protein
VFLLDHREHPKERIVDDGLADTQGPALLSFNDRCFSETDWDAVQRTNKSSKLMDTT